jgi:hypothetical protein
MFARRESSVMILEAEPGLLVVNGYSALMPPLA